MWVVVLLIVSAWLAAVTLAVLVLVREVSLQRAQLDVIRTSAGRIVVGGGMPTALVGSSVPDAVAEMLPALLRPDQILLALSITCAPCLAIGQEITQWDMDLGDIDTSDVTVLMVGSDRKHSEKDLIAQIADRVSIVQEPAASVVAQHLGLNQTPMAMWFDKGRVAGTRTMARLSDLVELKHGVPQGS
jgi:hypothetical protein